MADEPKNPELEKLRDDEEAARDALINAIVEYGRARAKTAYLMGYQKAQDDAKEHFAELAKRFRTTAPLPPVPTEEPTLFELATSEPRATLPPANDIVLDAIKANPGLRGVQLLAKIREQYPSLHERTFRTSLHRLKVPSGQPPEDGQLVSFERRWYVYPDVPEEAKPALQRIVDMVADTADKLVQAAKRSPLTPKDEGGQQ